MVSGAFVIEEIQLKLHYFMLFYVDLKPLGNDKKRD